MLVAASSHHYGRNKAHRTYTALPLLHARLMPAKYVRPYSKRPKNDFRDAEAIAEAVQRPTMKFVATKTAEQPRRDIRRFRRPLQLFFRRLRRAL